jgi:hypothetical protein
MVFLSYEIIDKHKKRKPPLFGVFRRITSNIFMIFEVCDFCSSYISFLLIDRFTPACRQALVFIVITGSENLQQKGMFVR